MWAETQAVPDLAARVLGTAQQRGLSAVGQQQPGLRLVEAGQVVEVAVVAVGVVVVGVARTDRRGGQHGDAAAGRAQGLRKARTARAEVGNVHRRTVATRPLQGARACARLALSNEPKEPPCNTVDWAAAACA